MTANHQYSHTILFVDDEEKARKMFTRLVSTEFKVLSAANVAEAKKILEENHSTIGVLITDQRMPGEFGVDLLRFVRQEYPKIIRVLTTAYSDLDDAIAAVNTGEIFRYINKPWNADELLIDLRLAMKVFELEQDKHQLIQEKMSLSQRQSKMEIMESIITMTSAQLTYSCPQLAVKSFLEQLAEPQHIASNRQDSANPVANSSFWQKELAKTRKLTQINKSLNEWTAKVPVYTEPSTEQVNYQTHIDQIAQNLSCHIRLTTSAEGSPTVLNAQGMLAILEVIATITASSNQSYNNLTVDISSAAQSTLITVSTQQPNNWLSSYLFNPGDTHTEHMLGKLLGVFALVYHCGGNVKLDFDEDALNNIQVTVPQTQATDCKELDGSIWIEDLFVLFN